MIPWLPLLFERMSRNFLMCSAVSISSAKGHAKQVDAAYAKECALEGMARTQVIWLKEGVIKE